MPEPAPKAAKADTKRVFRDGPYAAKWMDGPAKETIYYAARRAKQPQGEWLAQAAAEKIARERAQDTIGDSQVEVLAPERAGTNVALTPGQDLSLAELEIAVRLAAHLASLRGQKLTPGARNASARTLLAVQRLLAKRITGT